MSHDLRAAYEHSQLTTDRSPDGAEIAALLSQGRHVVVMDYLDYCRITDASLPGTTRRLAHVHGGGTYERAAFGTLAEATRCCDRLHDDEDESCAGETSYRVLAPDGSVAHPIAPPAGAWMARWTEAGDDCPF